jgi:cytosine/adenosine deaminase-related metal-dependent hydrolase
MKRWLLLVIAAIVVALSAAALRHVSRAEAKKKREAAYQSALQAYSRNLRPGLTRKEVEDDFRTRHISFGQICCVEDRSAFADLIRVGQEDAPWYCSENYVYIAFEFTAVEPHHPLKAYDTDSLKTVTLFRQLGGCL